MYICICNIYICVCVISIQPRKRDRRLWGGRGKGGKEPQKIHERTHNHQLMISNQQVTLNNQRLTMDISPCVVDNQQLTINN